LIVSSPALNRSRGQACSALVELVDLYPTVADLTGLAAQAPSILQGRSLRPLLASPNGTWDRENCLTVTVSQGASLRNARWRFSSWGQAGEELYDHDADPQEIHNLIDSPDHAAIAEELRDALALRLESSKQ
ncbi:MAG: DUF4976 domain-containing protein, partial [Planctomycetales bacterium]|nr:DUF4976 domain-containing protein [Planctomycetales bacterium]